MLFVLSIFLLFPPAQVMAGSSVTLAPAKKVFEVKQGEEIDYTIGYTVNDTSGNTKLKVSLSEYYVTENGNSSYIEKENIIDLSQSLFTWVTFPEIMEVAGNKTTHIPIKIKVPDNASYGDHLGVIFIEGYAGDDENSGVVTIKGRLASLIILKVLGGESLPKAGNVTDFKVSVRERARNTVDFEFVFQNTGPEYFYLETNIDVFEAESSPTAIKNLRNTVRVFPNEKKKIIMPLGELGDNYGEKLYFSKVTVREQGKEGDQSLIKFAEFSESFFYYVPVSDNYKEAAPTIIEKEVLVAPPIIAIVKELFWYVLIVLVVLVVLIRFLFMGGHNRKKFV